MTNKIVHKLMDVHTTRVNELSQKRRGQLTKKEERELSEIVEFHSCFIVGHAVLNGNTLDLDGFVKIKNGYVMERAEITGRDIPGNNEKH